MHPLRVLGATRHRAALVLGLAVVLVVASLGTASFLLHRSVHAQRLQWQRVDHRAEQEYWAQRQGSYTGNDLSAARSKAAQLPKGQQLPSSNHRWAPAASTAQGPSGMWHTLGPAPIVANLEGGGTEAGFTGRVTSLAVDPKYSQVVYAGAAAGGVWKTVNAGYSWFPLTDGQSDLAIGALAIDPNNDNVIYAGTGEGNQSGDSYYGSGVLKTTDGGTNWALLGTATFGTRASAFNKIMVDPRTSHVFAATTLGFFVSADGGNTWSRPSNHPADAHGVFLRADDLGIDPTTNPTTVYMTLRGGGLYKSTDGGSTVTLADTGLPAAANWHRSALAVAPSNPQIVYVIVTQDETQGHVYVPGSYNGGYYSTNGGATWTQMASLNLDFTASGSEAQGWYDLYLAVDPLDDELVYGGGIDVGMTWNARAATGNWMNATDVYGRNSNNVHPDQHAIAFTCFAFNDCSAYFGNDGGIYHGDPNATPMFTALGNNGLSISEFTGGDVGPNYVDNRLALGGTQDNGTAEYIAGTGTTPLWPQVWGGDGGFTAIDPTNSQVMYTENFGVSLVKSTDGGNFWSDATNGLFGSSLFYMPFVLDHANTNHVVAGTNAVYESTNGASNWFPSSQVFTYPVSAVAVAPSNSAVIYAGLTDGEVFRTSSGESGSAQVYTAAASLDHYVTSIAVDPNDPTGNTVIVTTGRFDRDAVGHIFKSTNGGASWSDITGALPRFPINSAVVYYSGSSRVIVIGTDYGVYFTTTDGSSWSQLNAYLPNAPVAQLAMDTQRSTIIAFTHGRGAFAIDIPSSAGGTGDTIGVYHRATYFLRNSMSPGYADEVVNFGTPSMIPIAGDWVGDGMSRVGVYDPSTGVFALSTANYNGAPVYLIFPFGPSGCKPVVGDWTGKGSDGIGVYCNGVFFLKNTLWGGPADFTMTYGSAGDIPVAGDWTGQGHDTVGVYHPSNGAFYLTNTVCHCNPSATYGVVFGPPNSYPFAGDWTHTGRTGLGVLYPTNGVLYARNDATHGGIADFAYVFGSPNDRPVAGHWI